MVLVVGVEACSFHCKTELYREAFGASSIGREFSRHYLARLIADTKLLLLECCRSSTRIDPYHDKVPQFALQPMRHGKRRDIIQRASAGL